MIGQVKKLGNFVAGTSLTPKVAAWTGLTLLAVCALLIFAAVRVPTSGNPASRLATVESLVDDKTWSLDDSIYRYDTVDKVRIGPHYYSSKPPTLPASGAAFYAGFQGVTGLTFAEDADIVVGYLRIVLQVVPLLFGFVLVGRFLTIRGATGGVWFWCLLAFVPGSFVFGYSASINNHSIAALLLTISAAMAFVGRGKEEVDPGSWMCVGFLVSLGVVLDFGGALFGLGIGLFALIGRGGLGRLGWLVVGAGLPVLIHFHMTANLSGSFEPLYRFSFIYHYPGSYWNSPGEFDAVNEHGLLYAFHCLVGHHGLFTMTPVFLFSIPGCVKMIRSTERRAEGLLIAGVCVGTILTYLLWGPRNYGGMAMGMRWFIVLTPLLWLSAASYAIDNWSSRRVRVGFVTAVLVSASHACYALTGPWDYSWWNRLWQLAGWGSVAG